MEPSRRVSRHYFGRNPECFLIGASWMSAVIDHRLLHIYLGPWLLTIKVPS